MRHGREILNLMKNVELLIPDAEFCALVGHVKESAQFFYETSAESSPRRQEFFQAIQMCGDAQDMNNYYSRASKHMLLEMAVNLIWPE